MGRYRSDSENVQDFVGRTGKNLKEFGWYVENRGRRRSSREGRGPIEEKSKSGIDLTAENREKGIAGSEGVTPGSV